VQSVANPGNGSPATFLARMQPPAGIIYKRVTSDFFVVSSVRKDRIWYNRCNRGNGAMNCVMINYPVAEKRQWDGVVTRISRPLASNSGDVSTTPRVVCLTSPLDGSRASTSGPTFVS